MKRNLLSVFICIVLLGCNSARTGDKLYIAAGYANIIADENMTEVAALPWFTRPFISIAKNEDGEQFAFVFRSEDQYEKVRLPVKYEEIIDKVAQEGYDIKKSKAAVKNLHLFEHDMRFYWHYSGGDGDLSFDLNGNKIEPDADRGEPIPYKIIDAHGKQTIRAAAL